MKLRLPLLTLAAVLMTSAAGATSLAKVPEDRIRDYLAELSVVGFYCKDFNLRHNMLDLVWDVLELKAGKDPNDDSQIAHLAPYLEAWEAQFKSNVQRACEQAYVRFGPDGSSIRDAIYRK